MKRRFSSVSAPAIGLLAVATLAPLSGGCEGFEFDWTPVVDTVSLYSLSRPEYIGRPGAFDFYSRAIVVVEQPQSGDPSSFDVAFSEVDGEPVFVPAGLFATFPINPGIGIDSSGITFDELAEAPRDGYITDEIVPVDTSWVYTVRTRQDGRSCTRYAKFSVLEVDPQGVVTFQQVRNNLCNDRELIPPDDR